MNEPNNNNPIDLPIFENNQKTNPNLETLPINDLSTLPLSEEQKIEVEKTQTDYFFRGFIFTLLSIVILFLVYFVYKNAETFLYNQVPTEENKLVFENELIRADKSRVISLEAGASKETVRNIIIQALRFERLKNGEMSLIMPSYLRETIVKDERKLVSELQRGDDFFFTFFIRAPLNLRTISAEKYALGVIGSEDGNKNFLAFSVASAPDGKREMLRYESEIYNDLKQVLNLRDIKGELSFKDLSENNHILRIAYDDDGVILVYGFGAPKTIIVAPNPDIYQTVFARLK